MAGKWVVSMAAKMVEKKVVQRVADSVPHLVGC